MNRLPQEIYDEIGTLLQGPDFDRPALATVSRQWQAAIEQQTFRKIWLRSTDLDRFKDIVQHSRRRYVTEIDYIIVLPLYGDDKRCRFEREDERRVNDDVFTAALFRLFSLLRSWNVSKDGYIGLCLRDVYSSADHPFLRRASPSFDAGTVSQLRRDENHAVADLWGWRFRYSYLRLLHPSQLPTVPVISSLSINSTTRNVCDRVLVDLTAKLPNIRQASWRLIDWEIRYLGLRRAHRHDLARAFTEVFPRSSSLQSLVLRMGSIWLWAPNFSAGTLNLDNSSRDELSSAIRTATGSISTLKELLIDGPIDGSLLWPGPAHALSEPYWQNLERLEVEFSGRRPPGGSYFRAPPPINAPPETEVPPGYGHSKEEDAMSAVSFSGSGHIDRISSPAAPDNDSLVPLIDAFGHACLQMPKLVSAQLTARVPASSAELRAGRFILGYRFLWGVWYFSPDTLPRRIEKCMDPAFLEDVDQRRLFWTVRDWRPTTDLRCLLGEIGCERYGIQLVERFL
ncbi:hypothetical protein F5Y03DRAFT_163040 [Xylaria venustula]|nr:hypothetical protein F5Y03DRAFT_163040 [Xylaria venustula]